MSRRFQCVVAHRCQFSSPITTRMVRELVSNMHNSEFIIVNLGFRKVLSFHVREMDFDPWVSSKEEEGRGGGGGGDET